MAGPKTPLEVLRQRAEAVSQHGNTKEAALALGLSKRTVERSMSDLRKLVGNNTDAMKPQFPKFPDDDLPVPELIDVMTERSKKRMAAADSKRWFPIKMPTNEPIAVSFLGDPHVDDDGCNWELLRHHAELHKKNTNIYAVNIGDSINNWSGRLSHLYAEQETSRSTAWKLAEWLMEDSGFEWLIWIIGNHDRWNAGSEVFKRMGTRAVPIEDWACKCRLVFPNKREVKLDVAHDHPGRSQWNDLHAETKAAKMGDAAHIYVSGHQHRWGLTQMELAEKGIVSWLARVRGYKYIDSYARHRGYEQQKHGAAVTAVIDPEADEMGLIHCFADMEEGVDFLHTKRRKRK